MRLHSLLVALALATACIPPLGVIPVGAALADEAGADKAHTSSGHAWAEVRRATVKDDVLHVEVYFLTDYVGYSGEKIYENIPADRLNASIYVMKGDQTFPLWLKDGQPAMPDKLELTFNYDPQRNPRVGKWQADFVAPGHDVKEAFLQLPNVELIGPFPIRRH